MESEIFLRRVLVNRIIELVSLCIAVALLSRATPSQGALPELEMLRRRREEAWAALRGEVDARGRAIDSTYREELDRLYRRLLTQGRIRDAMEVVTELRRVFPEAEIPTVTQAVGAARVDWQVLRQNLSYRYKNANFGRGAYDYSDPARRKLIDGEIREFAFAGTVAFDGAGQHLIGFEFALPVRLTRVRIHVLGGRPESGYRAPRSVAVFEGDRMGPTRLLSLDGRIPDQTGWVELPFKMAMPSRFLWIAIEKNDAQFVCFDEIEFR